MNFTQEEDSQSVEIKANSDWKVSEVKTDWVTVTPIAGNGVGVSGTKTLSFYGVAWKEKSSKLIVLVNNTEVTTISLKANDGATGSPTYTITLDKSNNYYSVELTGLTTSSTITFKSSGARVLLTGVKLQ